ncbi:MAG: hypothetical protein Q7N50_05095 [Armatimonadota bacterium]|nr:hypothetical protein [Armatimonadota bacterium]
MDTLQIKLRSELPRSSYVVEQGIPILPVEPSKIDGLRLLDEKSKAVPASIEHDGRNEHGQTVWVRVSAPVDMKAGQERNLTLEYKPDLPRSEESISIRSADGEISVENPFYRLKVTDPGHIELSSNKGTMLDGDIRFQLWPDARSIIGAGSGTCRLADFIPEGWSVEEQTDSRCLLLLRGRVPKYAQYAFKPEQIDPNAQFDCELEMVCYASSPVIRLKWRFDNYTVWQAYLERYTLALPLAGGAAVEDGERSEDGKFLRYVNTKTPGGKLTIAGKFVDALGAGAGINAERRQDMSAISFDDVISFTPGRVFEPHRYLAAESDDGTGLDVIIGGVNPPRDGDAAAAVPEIHRLFYLGMGRTFEGALFVNCDHSQVEAEMSPVYFGLDPNHYSQTGALPENGDPVNLSEFKDQVSACAEWLLRNQWRGTLWWREWWREWDVCREQGIEGVSSGNSPLGPLYHYWHTGDERFADCAKRSLEFTMDVQLSKRRGGLGTFFQCRRFLIDKMEWVHMRYQRIEGSIKASHFFGDRRLRNKVIDSMGAYADKLVYADGGPGYGSGGPYGKSQRCGVDCVNFAESLVILWRETREERFLEMAKRMAKWTMRFTAKADAEGSIGNSNQWRYVMRGMLAVVKATGDKKLKEWYIDRARKNMTFDSPEFGFIINMTWMIIEAEKMSGETWLLDALRDRLGATMAEVRPDGRLTKIAKYPWSKWPSTWDIYYEMQHTAAYVPTLAARLAARRELLVDSR